MKRKSIRTVQLLQLPKLYPTTEKHYSSTTQVVFLLKITTYLKGRKNMHFKINNLQLLIIKNNN